MQPDRLALAALAISIASGPASASDEICSCAVRLTVDAVGGAAMDVTVEEARCTARWGCCVEAGDRRTLTFTFGTPEAALAQARSNYPQDVLNPRATSHPEWLEGQAFGAVYSCLTKHRPEPGPAGYRLWLAEDPGA